MKIIDADALEELFRGLIYALSRRPELKKDHEYIIRGSAVLIEMINDAPAIEVGNMWIPATEKLPEDECDVLVTINGEPEECEYYVSIDCIMDGDWFSNEGRVKAWMPLPKPYEVKDGSD